MKAIKAMVLVDLTDLHATTETKDKVKSRLFLDVVVRKSTSIFELLARKNQTLLIRRYAFFVLNFDLDVVDRVAGLNLKGYSLAGNCNICGQYRTLPTVSMDRSEESTYGF